MAIRDTKTRILVVSLQLFNENSVAGTTTNEIADTAGISPGNLHYHFNQKSRLIDALITEFREDVQCLLVLSDASQSPIEDFWTYLHNLLEILAAYRFMFRDTDKLIDDYPQIRTAMRAFVTTLLQTLDDQIDSLVDAGLLDGDRTEQARLTHNIATVALFSDRIANLALRDFDLESSQLYPAQAVLHALLPLTTPQGSDAIQALADQYAE